MSRYDVIVVGARCAGATLATMLARSGAKTLMLDAHAMPSDMPMSTHYIHTPGMDVLDEIGVGEKVRACTPPTKRFLMRMEQHDVSVDYPSERFAYCPRRSTIDPLLQEAAVGAGAEMRDRTRVVDLVREGDRVTGVIVEGRSGRETIHAQLVVGADGRNSTVAKLAQVEEYHAHPMTRSGYWFYAQAPKLWHDDPRFAQSWQAFMGWEGDGLRYVFLCDGGQLIFVAAPPAAEVEGWDGKYLPRTVEYMARSPVLAPLVRECTPIDKGVGIRKAHWFYRRPVGPGFALVGDAGTFKDFVTGHGMTDAFIGARRLHRAIMAGTDAAMERFWRERDAETAALYFDAVLKGELGYNNAFMRRVFERFAKVPALGPRLREIVDRTRSPFDALSMPEILGVVGRAVLQGDFAVLPDFLRVGKRMNAYKAEAARFKSMVVAAPEMSMLETAAA